MVARKRPVWYNIPRTTGSGEGTGLELRQAKGNESAQILEMYRSAVGGRYCTWDEGYPGAFEIAQDLAAGTLYVLEDAGALCGAISVVPENELDGQECWTLRENAREFSRVVIAPAYRGKGLSRRLVGGVLDVLRGNGASAVHIAVARKNIPAQRLYAGAGFAFRAEADLYGHSFFLCEKCLVPGRDWRLEHAKSREGEFAALYKDYFRELNGENGGDPTDAVRFFLSDPYRTPSLILVGEEAAGLLVTSVAEPGDTDPDAVCLEELYLDAGFRGRGIAGEIFGGMIRRASGNVGFFVAKRNTHAKAVWEHLLRSEGHPYTCTVEGDHLWYVVRHRQEDRKEHGNGI